MGKTHLEQLALKEQQQKASTLVKVGAQYRHYKAEHKIYTVLNLAFQEDNNELCVIYQAEYEEKLVFIRPLASWIDTVEWSGKTVPRFTQID